MKKKELKKCPSCKGKGWVSVLDRDGYGYPTTTAACSECRGTGKIVR
jgi:DnaJ-class molecular chaperone